MYDWSFHNAKMLEVITHRQPEKTSEHAGCVGSKKKKKKNHQVANL